MKNYKTLSSLIWGKTSIYRSALTEHHYKYGNFDFYEQFYIYFLYI